MRFWCASRSVGLGGVDFDPADCVLGQQAWGGNSVCTHGHQSINSQRWFGHELNFCTPLVEVAVIELERSH